MRRDLKTFEIAKDAYPRGYKRMKRVLRVNGLMCIAVCLFFIVAALAEIGREPAWKILLVTVLFGVLLVVMVRWWIWSLRKD
jgi:hypothetical protein